MVLYYSRNFTVYLWRIDINWLIEWTFKVMNIYCISHVLPLMSMVDFKRWKKVLCQNPFFLLYFLVLYLYISVSAGFEIKSILVASTRPLGRWIRVNWVELDPLSLFLSLSCSFSHIHSLSRTHTLSHKLLCISHRTVLITVWLPDRRLP